MQRWQKGIKELDWQDWLGSELIVRRAALSLQLNVLCGRLSLVTSLSVAHTYRLCILSHRPQFETQVN
ncbi:hypothetical protein Nepgr_006128 [Nepenthes gracilis]|uniref:Uncharacterized protein n=1 Tax=Nepenthes gracilis TaxID=150966 RepID=A0AAD3XH18_NEPGR|nr:hypothetical protein Nepgr_006128 [Nepenthes gracilis]